MSAETAPSSNPVQQNTSNLTQIQQPEMEIAQAIADGVEIETAERSLLHTVLRETVVNLRRAVAEIHRADNRASIRAQTAQQDVDGWLTHDERKGRPARKSGHRAEALTTAQKQTRFIQSAEGISPQDFLAFLENAQALENIRAQVLPDSDDVLAVWTPRQKANAVLNYSMRRIRGHINHLAFIHTRLARTTDDEARKLLKQNLKNVKADIPKTIRDAAQRLINEVPGFLSAFKATFPQAVFKPRGNGAKIHYLAERNAQIALAAAELPGHAARAFGSRTRVAPHTKPETAPHETAQYPTPVANTISESLHAAFDRAEKQRNQQEALAAKQAARADLEAGLEDVGIEGLIDFANRKARPYRPHDGKTVKDFNRGGLNGNSLQAEYIAGKLSRLHPQDLIDVLTKTKTYQRLATNGRARTQGGVVEVVDMLRERIAKAAEHAPYGLQTFSRLAKNAGIKEDLADHARESARQHDAVLRDNAPRPSQKSTSASVNKPIYGSLLRALQNDHALRRELNAHALPQYMKLTDHDRTGGRPMRSNRDHEKLNHSGDIYERKLSYADAVDMAQKLKQHHGRAISITDHDTDLDEAFERMEIARWKEENALDAQAAAEIAAHEAALDAAAEGSRKPRQPKLLKGLKGVGAPAPSGPRRG